MVDHAKIHSPVNIDIIFPLGFAESPNLDHEVVGAVLDRTHNKELLNIKGTCESTLKLQIIFNGRRIKDVYSTLPCQLSKDHTGKHAYTRPTQTVLSWESHE